VQFSPTAPGLRTAAIHIASNDGDENPFDINLTGGGLDPNLTLPIALDVPGSAITNGGQVPWFPQSITTHDGVDAAQSGDISDNQSSSFSLVADGPGNVTFWWKVSSEASFDYLRFFIDGVEQAGKISGSVDWQQKTYALTSGSHVLQWSYSKDSIATVGSDCGWVDQVVLPIPASPLAAWRQTYFGSSANSGNGADTYDFDLDGLPNLLEFAFNLDPTKNSAGQIPRPQIVGSNFVVTFTQPASVSGVTYGAEWSTSLLAGSWTAISDTGLAPQHIFSVPIGTKTRLYMRLKVTNP
jgi:hypothetical protein